MYHLEMETKPVSLEHLKEHYFDREYFLGFCMKCPNYGRLWSCPPYDFDTLDVMGAGDLMHLVGTKIVFDEHTIMENDTREIMISYTEQVMREVKNIVDTKLRGVEKAYTGRTSFSSGGCRLCDKCAKLDGTPCRQRGRMRYSLEAMGFDVTRMAEEELQIKLLWAKDALPPYYVLVNGILVTKAEEGLDRAIEKELQIVKEELEAYGREDFAI